MCATPSQQQQNTAVGKPPAQTQSSTAPRVVPKPVRNSTPSVGDDGVARITWWLALWTGCLVGVAAVQAGLFVWQLWLIQKSLRDTKLAAEAARDSADVAAAVQSPFVTFSHATAYDENAKPGYMGLRGALPSQFAFDINLRNWGGGPAFVHSASFDWTVAATLPPAPIYSRDAKLEAGLVISPISEAWKRIRDRVTLTPQDSADIQSGDRRLWVWAKITYADFLDRRVDYGFAMYWAPDLTRPHVQEESPNAIGWVEFRGNGAYSYHRKRQPPQAPKKKRWFARST